MLENPFLSIITSLKESVSEDKRELKYEVLQTLHDVQTIKY